MEELIELYIKSNPNYDRREEVKAPEPKVDVHSELKHAFYLLAQAHLLNQQSDVANAIRHLEVPANTGDRSAWEKQAQAWASNFANLATKAEGNFHGVTFEALHSQIETDFQSIPEKVQQKPVESQPVEQTVAQAEPVAAVETVQQAVEVHPEEENKDGLKEEHNVTQDG